MTELLVFLLVAAAYALGKARDERDRLLRALQERRDAARVGRAHWQPLEHLLEAEQAVWRQTAALHRAARRAMHEVVAEVRRQPPPVAARPAPPVRAAHQPAPTTPPAGLSAEDVHRLLRGTRQ